MLAGELEEAILTRLHGIADPTGADPAYVGGLRDAVGIALGYALEVIELGERRAPPPPPALLAQARMAARGGVGLDTVLRRYIAGYLLLGEILHREAERGNLAEGATSTDLMRGPAAVLDRLLAAVSEEYAREADSMSGSAERQRVQRIERLLGGELLDTSHLDYRFDAAHLGLVAIGRDAGEAVRVLASMLDRQLLAANPEEDTVWAWLGGRHSLDPAEVQRIAGSIAARPIGMAIGEPGEGMSGWRMTHEQSRMAIALAVGGEERIVRYANVAILVSVRRDRLLASSLRQLYLEPLKRSRDEGATARETLRAYFAAGRNISSAGVRMSVSRQTVASRLRSVEERLGRPLDSCALELELALRLESLASTTPG